MPALVQKKSKLLGQVIDFLKFLAVLICVWLIGLCGLSIAWVCVLSVFVYIWIFEGHNFSLMHPLASLQHLRDQTLNTDQAVWLSKVFAKLWPYSKDKVDQFMRNQLQSSVRNNLPSTLQSFTFTTIQLGEQVPQVLAVEVKDSDKSYVILDIEILYNSDADIGLSIGKLESSVRDLQVHGTLRVVLTELNTSWPFFGKMNLSFVSPPSLHFRLAKAASLFDIAGVRDIIHENMVDQLTSLLVLPNYLTIAVNSSYTSSTDYPLPQGVLKVQINRAKDLPTSSDISDDIEPYCVIQIGASRQRTATIGKTNHPMWNEAFEFIVSDVDNQFVEIQCIDASDTEGTGSLGSCYVSLSALLECSSKTMWLTLSKAPSGAPSVNITCSWFTLSDDMKKLEVTELVNSRWKSTAVLSVGVESASNLPDTPTGRKNLRALSRPSPYIRLTLDKDERRTSAMRNTNEATWGENYYFLCSDPTKQELQLEVWDDVTNTALGRATYSLNSLLESPTVRGFHSKLVDCEEASIKLNLLLRSLVDSRPEPPAAKEKLDGEIVLTQQSFQPLVSTPVKTVKPKSTVIPDNNDSSSGQSDLLDFDNWSETESNGIPGGSTYMVISRPDGSTVSEIIQNSDEATQLPKGQISIDESKYGKMQITLRYSTPQQKLFIVVHQCSNLQPMRKDKEHFVPDPFVVLSLYSGRSKQERKKTKVQKATINPIFDETFDFKIPKSSIDSSMVELRVKNKKSLFQKGKSTIGNVLLRTQALDLSEPHTDWYLITKVTDSIDSLNDFSRMSQSVSSRA